jgi:hypothetical protein
MMDYSGLVLFIFLIGAIILVAFHVWYEQKPHPWWDEDVQLRKKKEEEK